MIVAVTGTFAFGLLLALNWWIGRSIIYPGVAFAGIWTLEFVAQILAAGTLYAVPWDALAIFLIGGACFTAGAVIGNGGVRRRLPPTSPMRDHRSDRWILWAMGVALLAAIPLFLAQVRAFSSAPLFSADYFLQVRSGSLNQAAELARVPLVNNLVVLSSIVALIAFAVTDAGRRSRVLVWGLVVLALFYNLLTAAKTGAVTLVVGLFAIQMVLRRRVPVRMLLLAFAGVLALFAVVSVGRLGTAAAGLGWGASLRVAWRTFIGYFSASPVAFGVYLHHPDLVPAVWSPWRFFERTANYFGNFFQIRDLNAQFVNVGPDASYNTYTAYFSYYAEYGIAGVVGFMTVIGTLSARIYRLAVSGRLTWLTVFAIVFYGLVVTIFNESLLLALNPILKLAAIALLFQFARRLRFPHRSKPVPPVKSEPLAGSR